MKKSPISIPLSRENDMVNLSPHIQIGLALLEQGLELIEVPHGRRRAT